MHSKMYKYEMKDVPTILKWTIGNWPEENV